MSTVRTIGRVAKEVGIGVETVRYYERQGLLDQPKRTGKPRHYDDRALATLKYIRVAQGFGLTLREIKSLKGELGAGRDFCGSLRALVEAKLARIDQQELELRTLKQDLNAFLNQCRSKPEDNPCPVVTELTRLDFSINKSRQ